MIFGYYNAHARYCKFFTAMKKSVYFSNLASSFFSIFTHNHNDGGIFHLILESIWALLLFFLKKSIFKCPNVVVVLFYYYFYGMGWQLRIGCGKKEVNGERQKKQWNTFSLILRSKIVLSIDAGPKLISFNGGIEKSDGLVTEYRIFFIDLCIHYIRQFQFKCYKNNCLEIKSQANWSMAHV